MSSYKICILYLEKRAGIVAKQPVKKGNSPFPLGMRTEKKFNNLLTDCKGERGSPKPIVTAAIWKTVKMKKVLKSRLDIP